MTIRNHCIPAYDELSRLRKVAEIPKAIEDMEEKTAGGIIRKIKAVLDSEYFKSLPNSKTIQAGANKNFLWQKAESKIEMERIWNECKNHV